MAGSRPCHLFMLRGGAIQVESLPASARSKPTLWVIACMCTCVCVHVYVCVCVAVCVCVCV